MCAFCALVEVISQLLANAATGVEKTCEGTNISQSVLVCTCHFPERGLIKEFCCWFIAVKLNAGRNVVGVLRGFDQFMNLVLDNTVEINGADKNEIGMVVSTLALIFLSPKFLCDIYARVLAPYIFYLFGEGLCITSAVS
jgi:small nuclear ribonucleoprotein (snRNP)-like protein